MNFLADESVDYTVVKSLRLKGYLVYSIAENSSGVDDECVLQIAHDKNAVLITEDKDFGELVYRLKKASKGVILLRLSGLASQQKSAIVIQGIKNHKKELRKAFTVITETNIRIRKIPKRGQKKKKEPPFQ